METKLCKKCQIEKSISLFQRDKSKKDGYRNSCKECQKIYHKGYYENNKESINVKNKNWKVENIEVVSKMSKDYYEKNKEAILFKDKIWVQKNKDKVRERKRKWYNKNRDLILNKKKTYIQNRKKVDPLYHLQLTIQCLIKTSFRKKDFNKPRTLSILGCSYEEFKIHIESQFLDGMNWENYGLWHLDHKIPVSWAKNEEELYKLNHFTNFQPLWAFENQSKSNKYQSI